MAAIATFVFLAFVVSAGAAWVAQRWIAAGDVPEPRCPICDYFLTTTTSNRCPECGADLHETGYWPPHQPHREPIVKQWIAWTLGNLMATPWVIWGLAATVEALPAALRAVAWVPALAWPALWAWGAWWLRRRWLRKARRPWAERTARPPVVNAPLSTPVK